MKKSMLFLTVVGLFCLPSLSLGYSVSWYEPLSGGPITGIEAYITGGTFTGPLTNFTQGDTGSGPALPGWTSFVADNSPYTAGTAVVATGDLQNVLSFNINFVGNKATIDFFPYNGVRTNLVSPEEWNFVNGQYTTQNLSWVPALPSVIPTDPPVQPSKPPVPETSTMLLLGAGLMGLWGARRKFRK